MSNRTFLFAINRLRHVVESYKLDTLRNLIRSEPLIFKRFRYELTSLCKECQQGCRKYQSNKENHNCFFIPYIRKALRIALKEARDKGTITNDKYTSLCLFFHFDN